MVIVIITVIAIGGNNCSNNGNISDDSNNCGCGGSNRSDLIVGGNFRGNRRVWR